MGLLINPRRACAARVTVVVLSVDTYSGTTGYEVANERHQWVQNYANPKNKRAFFLKRLRSRDMP